MEQGVVRKLPIGALQPGNNNAMIVGIIIGKSGPKKVVMKRDGTDRWVTTFTLRDSPSDLINLTVWSGREEGLCLKKSFHIGEVVEVVRPRIQQRDLTGRDNNFHPTVTSSFHLMFQEGKTILAPFLGVTEQYLNLLRIPSKGSAAFLSISDIVTNSGSLKGHFVDILAAVRSVGVERKIMGKEGEFDEDRGVREVRLFDQTHDCLLLKLWDSQLIRMAEEWIPRENILFLADVRIDYDTFKGAFIVVANSKTVVTVNPATREATALARYAQLVDFSTTSQLDQFVATIDPNCSCRVVNVMMVQAMCEDVVQSNESMVVVKLYGYITRFDIDCPEAVSIRCGACKGPFKSSYEFGNRMVCSNMECKQYNNARVETLNLVHQFDVRGDISDETGSLSSVKINQAMLERHLGQPTDFMNLSHQAKTAYKWNFLLKPMKIMLAVMLPTGDRKKAAVMIVDAFPSSLEEMNTKMPSPTL